VKGCYLRLAVVCLVGVGAGCTSAPVRYYTLTPTPDKTLPASEAALPVDVRVLHIPPQLDRAELLVRTGPSEVTVLDNEQWASPVKDEVKQALSLELQRRLGRLTVLRPALTRLVLDIDVQQLEAELGQYVLLEASWSATLPDAGARSAGAGARSSGTGARVTTCSFQAEQKIHGGYAEIVEGYQREIRALADAIVAVLTSPASSSDAACQKSIEGSAGGSGPGNP
jgi:uncharacterized protein